MTRTLTTLPPPRPWRLQPIAAPAPAEARGGGAVAAGVIGGLAAGAIIGGAVGWSWILRRLATAITAAARTMLPVPGCGWRRERFWDGYRWRVHRVQVCY